MIHNDIVEYCCEETGNKVVQLTDLPEKSTMPIDAWIDACCGKGEAPNGIDDAVALTKFMVGAYESTIPARSTCSKSSRKMNPVPEGTGFILCLAPPGFSFFLERKKQRTFTWQRTDQSESCKPSCSYQPPLKKEAKNFSLAADELG